MVPGGPCGNENKDIQPHPTPIMIQQVCTEDGFTLLGNPVQILDRGEFDGPLVEAPSLLAVKSDLGSNGYLYILFFSSNCFSTRWYDVSYATSVTGVFNGANTTELGQKADYEKSKKPLMTSDDGRGLLSPGGLDVDVEGHSVVFHTYPFANYTGFRQMRYGEIKIEGKTVII